MGFRENLKSELTYQGILVKELSTQAGISKHTVDNYLSTNNCIPAADIAVKIAHVLGVSVEYLITGQDSRFERTWNDSLNTEIRDLIRTVEALDADSRGVVLTLAKSLKKMREKQTLQRGSG
jgi:transcriptional regulator with XRE-family HTH domain